MPFTSTTTKELSDHPETKRGLEKEEFWIDCAGSPKRLHLEPVEAQQHWNGKIFFSGLDGNEDSWAKLILIVGNKEDYILAHRIARKQFCDSCYIYFLLFMKLPVTAHRTTVFPEIDLKTTVLDGLPSTASFSEPFTHFPSTDLQKTTFLNLCILLLLITSTSQFLSTQHSLFLLVVVCGLLGSSFYSDSSDCARPGQVRKPHVYWMWELLRKCKIW